MGDDECGKRQSLLPDEEMRRFAKLVEELTSELIDALDLIQEIIPTPGSEELRLIGTTTCTHCDTAVVSLYESIDNFKRFIGIEV
ncbi:MAG: hypothetical protein GY718_01860 [Lentisphaerae bacterium]|nr:hypothetical protein [Lentisphaerota bacterium]